MQNPTGSESSAQFSIICSSFFLYATAWLIFPPKDHMLIENLIFQVSPCVPLGAEVANQLTNHCPQSWSWTFPRWTWRHILATSSPFLLTRVPQASILRYVRRLRVAFETPTASIEAVFQSLWRALICISRKAYQRNTYI